MRMKHAAVVAGLALGLMSGTAKAAYIVDIEQVGDNVVVTGSGTINTTVFSSAAEVVGTPAFIDPSQSIVAVSADTGDAYYNVDITGPSNFGTGGQTNATSSSGDVVGLGYSFNSIIVPLNYVSNTFATGSSIFDDATFGSLGVAKGSYTYDFGNNGNFDTFTINVGTVPLPASAPMFGAALIGLAGFGYGLKRKKAATAA